MDKIKALVERWRREAQTSETVTQAILNDCAEELSQALADSAGVEVVLSEDEIDAISAMQDNAEHQAGDVDDFPPSIDDDEDAYWAYYAYHAIKKRQAALRPGG